MLRIEILICALVIGIATPEISAVDLVKPTVLNSDTIELPGSDFVSCSVLNVSPKLVHVEKIQLFQLTREGGTRPMKGYGPHDVAPRSRLGTDDGPVHGAAFCRVIVDADPNDVQASILVKNPAGEVIIGPLPLR